MLSWSMRPTGQRALGASLDHAFVEILDRDRVPRVEVHSDARRTRARRFYERLGFQPTSVYFVRDLTHPTGEPVRWRGRAADQSRLRLSGGVEGVEGSSGGVAVVGDGEDFGAGVGDEHGVFELG